MKRISVLTISTLIALTTLGCKSTPKTTIPRRGDVVAQGAKQSLSFRATAKGMVSVYDVDSDSVVHSSGVDKDSVVSVNSNAGTITVTDAARAGTQTVHTGLIKSHRYEIWFIQSGSSTQVAQ
jgi:hypothetical protein